jgi:hypothetical protein
MANLDPSQRQLRADLIGAVLEAKAGFDLGFYRSTYNGTSSLLGAATFSGKLGCFVGLVAGFPAIT